MRLPSNAGSPPRTDRALTIRRRPRTQVIFAFASRLFSSPSLIEIPQIGGRLTLAGGQQFAVGAFEIKLVADFGQESDPGAIFLAPDRVIVGVMSVGFGHAPRPREGIVDRRDLVVQQLGIALVEVDALLDRSEER